MSIALAHIGDEYPRYIEDCIDQILRFTKDDVHVCVPGKDASNLERFGSKVNIIKLEDLNKTLKWREFDSKSKLDKISRHGFWRHCTGRFFAIEAMAVKFGLTDILHIENDVMLYSDGNVLAKMAEEFCDVGILLENDDRCVPSVVYFKNADWLSKLTDHLLLNDKGLDDMVMLAMFYKKTPSCGTLPVLPPWYKGELRSVGGATPINPLIYSSEFGTFDGVFDGAAHGQYLGGISPRNSGYGTKKEGPGMINGYCLFRSSEFEHVWKEEQGVRVPYLRYGGSEFRLFNLHVHCKDLRKFKS